MIVEAINKRTGKPVKIKDARYGQRFACPYCSADMHPVLKAPNPFFRCNEGEKHKHYLCVQLDEPASKAYDPKRTDIEELFANLFRPVKEYNPPVLPPNNRNKPEKKPETGRVGTEPGEDAGGAVNDEPSTGFVEEPNEGEDDTPPEPVILPCRTLRQLWKAGISNFKSYERIGSYLRSDIFLWFVDFDRFLACHESLRKRILAVRPCWRVDKANAIVFLSHRKIPGTGNSKRKFFVLEFQERKEFHAACRKLFSRKPGERGGETTEPMYDMVLVAGDWVELDKKDYTPFQVKPDEHMYGVQRSTFYSKNQIYAIPEHKIKK